MTEYSVFYKLASVIKKVDTIRKHKDVCLSVHLQEEYPFLGIWGDTHRNFSKILTFVIKYRRMYVQTNSSCRVAALLKYI